MKYTSSLPRQLRPAPRSSTRGCQQVRRAQRRPRLPSATGGSSYECNSILIRKRPCRLKLPSLKIQSKGFTGRGSRQSELGQKYFIGEEIRKGSPLNDSTGISLSELKKLCHSQCLLFPRKIFARQKGEKNLLNSLVFSWLNAV